MKTFDWKNASPQQLAAWNYFKTLWGATPTILPIWYQGAIAASEYLTYSAKKIYFALELAISSSDGSLAIDYGSLAIGGIGGATKNCFFNNIPLYDPNTTTIKYLNNPVLIHNIFFTKITTSAYTYMIFNGYKVTWP